MSGDRKRIFLSLVALFIVGVATIGFFYGVSRPNKTSIPMVDATKLSREDAVKVVSARERLEANPQSADAWGNYGMALNAFEFFNEALACFRHAEELDTSNPRWPYFAHRLLIANDPAGALERLRHAVELCGNTAEAPRYRLAKTLAEAGAWSEAESEANKILSASPEFAPARLILAQAAIAKGDLLKGEGLAQKCVGDARTTKAGWALLATIHARQQNNAAAAEAARKAAAAPPDSLVFDPFEGEIDALRDNLVTLCNEAHSMLAARQLTRAQAIADRLVANHSEAAETWLVLGRLRLLQTNYVEAEQALRKHLQIETNSVQGWFQLGMVHLNTGQFADAAQDFQKATQLKSDFGPAWFNHGFALGRSGRLPEAAESFRQAIRYNPEHPDSYFLLADLELQSHRTEAAVRLLEQVEKIAPNDRRIALLRKKAGLFK